MEQVIKYLVLSLNKNLFNMLAPVLILCFFYENTEAGGLFKTNLEVVDSLVQKIAEEIPIKNGAKLCLLSHDKSEVASFIKNSIISGIQKRKKEINFGKDSNCSTTISFIVFDVSVKYRELKQNGRFSTKNFQREVTLELNVNLTAKNGGLLYNQRFRKTGIDTLNNFEIDTAEQKGRIIGKGIFMMNKRKFLWLEPVVSVVIITLIGSLFYWVRSN